MKQEDENVITIEDSPEDGDALDSFYPIVELSGTPEEHDPEAVELGEADVINLASSSSSSDYDAHVLEVDLPGLPGIRPLTQADFPNAGVHFMVAQAQPNLATREYPAAKLDIAPPTSFNSNHAMVVLRGDEFLLPYSLPESAREIIVRAYNSRPDLEVTMQATHNFYVNGTIPGKIEICIVLLYAILLYAASITIWRSSCKLIIRLISKFATAWNIRRLYNN